MEDAHIGILILHLPEAEGRYLFLKLPGLPLAAVAIAAHRSLRERLVSLLPVHLTHQRF